MNKLTSDHNGKIMDESGKVIGFMTSSVDAGRLVACANACADIKTENLKSVTDMGETLLGRFQARDKVELELINKNTELQEQVECSNITEKNMEGRLNCMVVRMAAANSDLTAARNALLREGIERGELLAAMAEQRDEYGKMLDKAQAAAEKVLEAAEIVKTQRDTAWEELRKIREAIKANPEESTFDEVSRAVSLRDELLAALEAAIDTEWHQENKVRSQVEAVIAKAKGRAA